MAAVHSLIPARFLTLTAHLVIVITIFWSRESTVQACLPLEFTQEEFNNKDIELVVGLSVTLGLFAVELAGFFSGVSMFNSSQSLLSTAAHASASVALLFFLFEQWPCHIYWWILGFCRSVSLWILGSAGQCHCGSWVQCACDCGSWVLQVSVTVDPGFCRSVWLSPAPCLSVCCGPGPATHNALHWCFFPDQHSLQRWLHTVAPPSLCPSSSSRNGSAGPIGLFLPSAVHFRLWWKSSSSLRCLG